MLPMRGGGLGGPSYGGGPPFGSEQALMPAGPSYSQNYHERLDYIQQELERLKVVEMDRRRMYQMQVMGGMPSMPSAGFNTPSPGGGFEQVSMGYRALMDAFNTLAKAHTDLLKDHAELVTKRPAQSSPNTPSSTTGPPGGSAKAAVPQVAFAGAGPPAANAPLSSRLWVRPAEKALISNTACSPPPTESTLLDNTLLFLPEAAVRELGLEPNMDDKGDPCKELWFGRVWELRSLLAASYTARLKKVTDLQEELTKERKQELARKMSDPVVKQRIIRMQARWKGTAYRMRCSLSVLERVKFATLRGTLIYAHGSGGCSWDNMRLCRMISRLGVLVIAPDGFAYPKNSAMGQLRHKDIQPLKKATDNVDYWEGDLIYSSDSSGSATYSTAADKVLENPDEYRKLYEKCFQLRRSELHYILGHLPQFIKTQGFFLGGTSEGGMTIARFDDQRYGEMVCGRFITSFSIEYNYFTPTPEAGEIGGQMDVPTLNIIGTKDQYFGPTDSVSKLVVQDAVKGYGDRELTGHGYKTMVRQGIDAGLVCVLDEGVHSPCDTHDNFLRQLFDHFFTRPGSIWELDAIWDADPTMKDLMHVQQSTVSDKREVSNVVHVFVPKMEYPQKWSLRKVETAREMAHHHKKHDELQAAMDAEDEAVHKKHKEAKDMLDKVRAGAVKRGGFRAPPSKENYYAADTRKEVNKARVKSGPPPGARPGTSG